MPDARIRYLNPPEIHTPVGYTHVVEAQPGRLAYISGQVAINPAGEFVGQGDIGAQTRQVFQNLKAALAVLSTDFGPVIKLNYYAVDESGLQEIRNIRGEYLPKDARIDVRVREGADPTGASDRD